MRALIGLNDPDQPHLWMDSPPPPSAQGPRAPFKLRFEPLVTALDVLLSVGLMSWLWPCLLDRPWTYAVGILSSGWMDPLVLWPCLCPHLLLLNEHPVTLPNGSWVWFFISLFLGPLMDPVTSTWLCPPCSDPVGPHLTGVDTACAGVTLGSWLLPAHCSLQSGPGSETPLPLSSPSLDFSPGWCVRGTVIPGKQRPCGLHPLWFETWIVT